MAGQPGWAVNPLEYATSFRFDSVSVISYALLGNVGVNSAIGLKRRALNRMGQSDVSIL